jgi:hypothetical protein
MSGEQAVAECVLSGITFHLMGGLQKRLLEAWQQNTWLSVAPVWVSGKVPTARTITNHVLPVDIGVLETAVVHLAIEEARRLRNERRRCAAFNRRLRGGKTAKQDREERMHGWRARRR